MNNVLLEWRSTIKEEFVKDQVIKAMLPIIGVIMILNLAILGRLYLGSSEFKSGPTTLAILTTVSFLMFFISQVTPKSYSLKEEGLKINWVLNKWKKFTGYSIDRERQLLLLYITWLGITSSMKIPVKDLERAEAIISVYLPRRDTIVQKSNTRKYVFCALVVVILFIFIYLSAYTDIYLREHYSFVNFSPVLIILGLTALLLTIVRTTWPDKFKVKPNIKDIGEELIFAFVLISGGLLLDLTGPVHEASFSEILALNVVFVSLIIYLGYRRGRRR